VVATISTAVVASSIALNANRISSESLETAKRQEVKNSEIAIATATPYLGDELDAKEFAAGDEESSPAKVRPPLIDITVKNSGEGAGLVTRISLRFETLDFMSACLNPGGGPSAINAVYQFTVPTPLPTAPYVMDKSVRYEVAANDYERFAITVGPGESSTMDGPWVAVVWASLFVDGLEKPLTAGPFALIQGAFPSWVTFDDTTKRWRVDYSESANNVACELEEAEELQTILARKDLIPSPEIASLGAEFSVSKSRAVPRHPVNDPALRKGECFQYTSDRRLRRSKCTHGSWRVLSRVPFTDDPRECTSVAGYDSHLAAPYPSLFEKYVLCLKTN
jgi:hypothetical protein